MKKLSYILIVCALVLFSSCAKEEIVFDHELPGFEFVDGKILLEVIVPQETLADEDIYIAGAFNGGDKAVENPKWKLQKSKSVKLKWGIYLDPSDFVSGKTLADGYHFIASKSGVERTPLDEDIMHYENPAPGERTNIYISRWQSYFVK